MPGAGRDPRRAGANGTLSMTDPDRRHHREEPGGPGRTPAARRRAAVRGRDPGGGEAAQIRHRSDARGGEERPGQPGHPEEASGGRWGRAPLGDP